MEPTPQDAPPVALERDSALAAARAAALAEADAEAARILRELAADAPRR